MYQELSILPALVQTTKGSVPKIEIYVTLINRPIKNDLTKNQYSHCNIPLKTDHGLNLVKTSDKGALTIAANPTILPNHAAPYVSGVAAINAPCLSISGFFLASKKSSI